MKVKIVVLEGACAVNSAAGGKIVQAGEEIEMESPFACFDPSKPEDVLPDSAFGADWTGSQ